MRLTRVAALLHEEAKPITTLLAHVGEFIAIRGKDRFLVDILTGGDFRH